MKLTCRLMSKGEHLGYCLEDGGIEQPIIKKLLYTKLYFHAMLDAGYKFYSYDPDTVEDAGGKLIVELPSREASSDEMEWLDMQQEQAITDAYPDSYCSKYYAFHRQTAVEFKRSSNYEINTRDELIEYLNNQREFFEKNSYMTDNRPLNSFVNPEALFSIDEIVTSGDARYALGAILNRHKFRNLQSYKETVNWLIGAGVLSTSDPTPTEFLQAYYSWGVDGIKDSCTSFQVKTDIDVNFGRVDEAVVHANALENRTQEYILIDNKQFMYFHKLKQDISDIFEFNRERIILGSQGDLLLAKRIDTKGFDYAIRKGWVSHPQDRLYYKFYTEEGYMYNVKISHDQFVIFSDVNVSYMSQNFSINSIVGGITYALDECESQQDYYVNNLAIMKAFDILRDRIKVTPFNSNFEMLVNDGVSVPAAITSVCLDAYNKKDAHTSNGRVLSPSGKQLLTLDAFSMYRSKVPTGVIDKLEIQDADISTEDLVDIINTMDSIDTSIEFEMNGVPISMADYCAKITFVSRILGGEVQINNFGDGVIKDRIASVKLLSDVILTSAYASCGANANREQLSYFISQFGKNNTIDLDKDFMYCDNGYKGYLLDFVNQRNERGNATNWMYCTAVYREMSNAPVSEQRDYAMEVITVPSFEKGPAYIRSRLVDAVESADMEGLTDFQKELVKTEAPFIAANLFFHILGGRVTDEYKNESGDFVVPLSTGIDNKKVKVTIASDVHKSVFGYDIQSHRKIVPVYCYCQFENMEHTTNYSWMLVNAVVTPWKVKPKKGYSINKYNFAINYYIPETFNNFSDEFKNSVAATKAKRDTLMNYGNPMYLVKWDDLTPQPNPKDETLGTITQYLDSRVYEDIHLYKTRWQLMSKEAKENGGILKTMLLKSDVVYSCIAAFCNEDIPTSNVVVKDGSVKANSYLTTYEPYADKDSDLNLISASETTRIRDFNYYNYTFEEMSRWDAIINNIVSTDIVCAVERNIIFFFMKDTVEKLNVKYLSREQLQSLADRNACYQLSGTQFLFNAINGSYVVEVLE